MQVDKGTERLIAGFPIPAMAIGGIALLVLSCGDGAVEPAPSPASVATTLTVSPSSAALRALGETARFTAEVRDQHREVMGGAIVAWASSDASVASVDASGLATASANGDATITATSGSVSDAAAVTVAQVVSAVAVSPSSTALVSLGDTVRLAAEGADANGNPVAAVEFSWTSDDPTVATVGADGLVTAVANGSATVTANYGTLGATVAVTVVDVAQFLEENSRVAEAMVWLGEDNQLRPYTRWPRRMKERLVLAVVELLGEGTGLPDVPTNQAGAFLNDDEFAVTVMSGEDAEDIYVTNIAHSLIREMDGTLSWSLDDLPDHQLAMLLGSEGFFIRYGRVVPGVPEGYVVNGHTGPAPPEVIRDFIEDTDLVRGSRYETIVRTVEWARHYLTHFSCWFTTANAENHWDYRGTPPLARMLAGTRKSRDQVVRLGEFECRTYADRQTEHYTGLPRDGVVFPPRAEGGEYPGGGSRPLLLRLRRPRRSLVSLRGRVFVPRRRSL